MLKVGRAYTAKNGRRFLILAKKTRPASNGCNFLGECNKSGVVFYFNHNGEHAFNPDFNLNCDPYKWIGVSEDGVLSHTTFVKREELTERYPIYLRLEDNDFNTVTFMPEEGFYANYI